MVPEAGIGSAEGGFGASFESPAGAPASAHAVRVLRSASGSRRSFENSVECSPANQGGIFPVSTAAFIALAQGRAFS